MISNNTKTTKAQLIAIANEQESQLDAIRQQQSVLFVITGLLLILHLI